MTSPPFPDGEGIFETILTVAGVPQLLNEHLQRARTSAQFLGWDFLSDEEIIGVTMDCLSDVPVATRLGRLRLVFTPNSEIVATHDSYLRWVAPARLTVSASILDETSPLVGIKRLPYRNNLEILNLAQNSGFDDAIRLNGKGEVGETSIANLVLKVQGKWITPPVSAGILPGIIRALAVDLLSIEERTISSKDLFRVESIFLLNSLKGFQPVAFLEDRALVIDTEMMEKVATLSQFNSVG